MNTSFLPEFVEPVLTLVKKHTMRRDVEDKMQPGKIMHCVHAEGYQRFAVRKIDGIEYVRIEWTKGRYKIFINDEHIDRETAIALMKNDGFKSFKQFEAFFPHNYKGKIIHWTPLRYGSTKTS